MSGCSGSSGSKGAAKGGGGETSNLNQENKTVKLNFNGVEDVKNYLVKDMNWSFTTEQPKNVWNQKYDELVKDMAKTVNLDLVNGNSSEIKSLKKAAENYTNQKYGSKKHLDELVDEKTTNSYIKVLGNLIKGGMTVPKDVEFRIVKSLGKDPSTGGEFVGKANQYKGDNGKHLVTISAKTDITVKPDPKGFSVGNVIGGNLKAFVMVHELGHIKAFNTSPPETRWNEPPKMPSSLSRYASTDQEENFAEAYTAKVIGYGKLSKSDRAIVDNILDWKGIKK